MPSLLIGPSLPSGREAASLSLCIALGAAGGWLFTLIGSPMPWMLGAITANALWCIILPGRLNPVRFPEWLRNSFVVIIGVMIGGMFTPELLGRLPDWWPGVVALFLYTVAAQVAGYALLRRVGGYDEATAWFGAAPGGLIENIMLGEAAGGDVKTISALHFLRIVFVIAMVPLGFLVLTGEVVGSAAGVTFDPAHVAANGRDYALLIGVGALGWMIGKRLGIPAGHIIGPILLSGATHLSGVVEAQPPAFAVIAAQVVIGSSLGARFAGLTRAALVAAARLTALTASGALLLAFGFGAMLAPLTGERPEVYVMAFAPGGVIEMSLVALTIGANPVFVTTHHILRILLTVSVTPALYRRFVEGRGG